MTVPPRDEPTPPARSSDRAELLARLRAQRAAPSRDDAPDPLLTCAQERFWFLEQLEPGNPAHHVAGVRELHGDCSPAALRLAVGTLVARHPALRTTFAGREGTPRPVVAAPFVPELPVIDLRELPPDRRDHEHAERLAHLLAQPFDLVQGPLLRQCLLRLGDDHWEHAFCIHHVAVDGLSMRVLARELADATAGRELPPAPDTGWLAAEQRRWLRTPAALAMLAAAQAELRDLPVLTLPAEREPLPGEPARGARLALAWTAAQRTACLQAAAALGVTPFQWFLGGFAAFLGRLGGTRDLVVGALAANRTDPRLRDAVGFFVNSLPLRLRWPAGATFAELARIAKAATLLAADRQQLPFERLVEVLAPQRHPTRHPLFAVLCNYIDFAPPPVPADGLRQQYRELVAGTLLELTLNVRHHDEQLRIEFEYDTRRFDAAAMTQWLASLRELLLAAADRPDAPVATLPWLAQDQLRWLATSTAGPALPPTTTGTVHELLLAALDRTGDRRCLRTAPRTLTGREIAARSTALAAQLHAADVGPGDRVVVALSRDHDLLPWLLALWRRGACVVPLDPGLPHARQRRLVRAAAAAFVLADATTRADLADDLPLRTTQELLAAHAPTPPALAIPPEQPAYVLFTSGSTGEPKGVVVPHRALVAFLVAAGTTPGLGPDDTMLAITSLGFDIAWLELLAPLVHGGAVHLADAAAVGDPGLLRDLVRDPEITVVQATPPTWNLLRSTGWAGRPDLRAFVGGQALPTDLAEFLRRHCAAAWNLYGPTETTVWSLAWRIGEPPIRIGRPLPGTWLRVLGPEGLPLPPGTPGELGIGGAGVALGYLQRPDETAARFLPDPLGAGTLYRTGDRVRQLPDGEFVFLGRLDEQRKVHGWRVEPEEIEAALRRHPLVADAAVAVRGDGDAARLCAWVVASATPTDDAPQLARWTRVWQQAWAGTAPDPAFDLRGWVDSATGQPMAPAAMRAFGDAIVAMLLASPGQDVLEIGCGGGLILLPLARAGRRAVGVDASAEVVAQLRAQATRESVPLELHVATADAIDRVLPPERHFDLIVLNSVVQYFPSLRHLLHVIDLAAARLRPGGTLFLGDVRLLPLQRAFAASVELARAADAEPATALHQRIEARCRRDPELLLAPELFDHLVQQHHSLTSVRIDVHRAPHDDELTRFRANVRLLRMPAGEPTTAPSPPTITTADLADARALPWVELLAELAAGTLPDAAAARRFVADRQAALAALPTPAELARATDDPLALEIRPTHPGHLEVRRHRPQPQRPAAPRPVWSPDAFAARHRELAADPLAVAAAYERVLALQAHLRTELPAALVPGTITFVPALPRSPGGKLLRQQLPDPEATATADWLEPAPGAEAVVAAAFAQVLGRARVSAHDDFFALGGHSLLAAQLRALLATRLGIDLPLRLLFAHPTVRGLALACTTAAPAPPEPVLPPPTDAPRRLTFAQERLWFLHRLDPESPAWHLAGHLHLHVRLPVAALQRAFALLQERHEPLRCAVDPASATPTLRPLPPTPLHCDPDPATFTAAMPARVHEPFDLADGPPLRGYLYVGDDQVDLLLVLHHLAVDGLSLPILARDFAALLRAQIDDTPPQLPALPFPLSHWAHHERTADAVARRQRDLDWWQPRLAAAPMTLDLPVDHGATAAPAWAGQRHRERLATALWPALTAFAGHHACTPFQVIGAAFAALLRRVTGNDDVVFGMVTAGRRHPDLAEHVGCFVDLLPLHVCVAGAATFRELVQQVRTVAVDALAHANAPFAQLVELRKPPRDRRRPPLVQVTLELLDLPPLSPALGLPANLVELPVAASKFDLTVRIVLQPEPTVEIDWATNRLAERTVLAWWRGLLAALAAGLGDPDLPIDALPLVPPAEQQAQLAAGRGPGRGQAAIPLHAAVFAAALRHPDAVAVIAADGSRRTFAALAARAHAIAARLRAAGVGPGDVVAVAWGRDLDLLPTLLACNAAGAAWLPLDPTDPPARHAQFVQLARVRHWLGQPPPAAMRDQLQHLPIDAAIPGPQALPDVPVTALAYVLFTSGSTGEPKAVAVPHRAAMHYLQQAAERYLADDGNGALAFSSLAFDLTLTSLFAPLLRGQPVHLAADGAGIAPLLAALPRGPFALLKLTPSHLRALRAAGIAVPPARTLVVGGEALLADDVAAAVQAGVTVVNEYGPTETTVGCTVHAVTAADLVGPAPSLPIGRPLAATTAYVLDDRQRLLPWGVIGELVIGGDGVADGYLHRPDATAARFLADPFAPGARVYRTGDRVRWRADGTLEFLGRRDHQVKILGVRVEPGEVTAALRGLAGVRDAIAVAVPAPHGGVQLCGYVVHDPTTTTTDLLEQLRARLPAAMVPRLLHALAGLPLTRNGKVDVAALPLPQGEPTPVASLEPLTPFATTLLAELRALLRTPGLAPDDDFFAAGGDSILALQLVAALRRQQLHLPLTELFARRTARAIATAITTTPTTSTRTFDPRLPTPLLPMQRAWLAAALPVPGHDVQAVVCELAGSVTERQLDDALQQLTEAHPLLRARLQDQHLLPGTGPLPTTTVSAAATPDADWAEANGSHDPAAGRLLRATLWRQPTVSLLHLSIHHLVVDAVSWSTLLADLDAALAGRTLAPAVPAHELASRQIQAAALPASAATQERWRPHAGGPTAPWPRAAATGVAPWQTLDLQVPAPVAGVAALATRHAASLHELLLAAFALACHRLARGPVRIAVERHGRQELPADLDGGRTIGWFTAVHPLRIDLTGQVDAAAALRASKQHTRALPADGCEFGIRRWLATDAFAHELADAPAPALLFNYLGQLDDFRGTHLRTTDRDPGPLRAAGNPLPHAAELDLWLRAGRLHGRLRADPARLLPHAPADLAPAFSAALAELAATPGAATRVPADHPFADLDASELAALLATDALPPADLVELLPTQQGMLVHALQQPTSPAYVEQLVHEVVGDLDADALRTALRTLSERHPWLRARMVWQGLRRPHWWIAGSLPLPFAERSVPTTAADADAWLRTFAAADRRSGFDLDCAPLWRCTLVHLTADHHALVFTWHHALLDGWSMPLLFAELTTAWIAARAHRPPVLPPVPPFTDHVAWLRRQDPEAARRFWRQQLAGVLRPTPLGIERRGHAGGATAHREAELRLPQELGLGLARLQQQVAVTGSSIVQAALALWLQRTSGDDDVVFGLTVSGRPADLPHAERRIGLFINTIPVRLRVDERWRVRDLLTATQRRQLELLPWHWTPLTLSQAQSDAPPGRPLFDVLLVYENYPLDDAVRQAPAGLHSVRTWTHERTSYPLTVVALPGTPWQLRVLFDPARIPAAAAHGLLDQLALLLQRFADAPERPLAEVALVAPSPAPVRPSLPPPAPPLAAALRAAFATHPTRQALQAGDDTLTYGELDGAVQQFAGALRARGAAAGHVVALRCQRGVRQVTALLAIWRLGATVLPLDLHWPAAFTDDVLRRAGADLLVTDDAELPVLPSGDRPADPGLALLLTTSGTTGTPRLVEIPHTALAHYVAAARAQFALRPDDAVLQFAALCFDTAFEELLPALCTGARVVLRRDSIDPAVLLAQCERAGVTVLDLPTAWFHALVGWLQAGDRQLPPSIRLCILGGEAVQSPPARWFVAHHPQVRLLNTYGPTEATIVACWCELTAELLADGSDPPIGTPVPGMTALVLDRHGQPLPIGSMGQLWLQGPQLAQGYRDDAAATAQGFVPLPIAGQTRCYRTGDRARWRPDGRLEFGGRDDRQHKLRGHRLELDAIERGLVQQPGITAAAAFVAGDGENARLLAAVVAGADAPDPATLRTRLLAQLPPAQVPARIVVVAHLPTNVHGKVDRAALAAVVTDTAPAAAEVAGLDVAAITRAMAEVLGHPIAADDDFFVAGGDSLAAVRLTTMLRQRLGQDVPLAAVFAQPTARALAGTLADGVTASPPPPAAFATDAHLADDLAVVPRAPRPWRQVLLTGATGFFGRHVLHALLQRTDTRIVALARSPGTDTHGGRVQWLRGTLADARLGLDAATWSQLATGVDAVLHVAADTSVWQPYQSLRPTNVLGTLAILRLCAAHGIALHHVSTIGVFADAGLDASVVADEEFDLDRLTAVQGGYPQTKLVAERLVRRAAAAGLPVHVYRPGRLVAGRDGLAPRLDFGVGLLALAIELGRTPPVAGELELAPGDWAAHALVHLALQRDAAPSTWHLLPPAPQPTGELLQWLAEAGHPLREVPYPTWRRTALAHLQQTQDHPLRGLLPLLQPEAPRREPGPRVIAARTHAALVHAGLPPARLDAAVVRSWLRPGLTDPTT